jgi:O-antigen ligase
MIRNMRSKVTSRESIYTTYFPLVLPSIVLLLAAGSGILLAFSINKALSLVDKIGVGTGTVDLILWVTLAVFLSMALILSLRLNELAATAIIAINIIVDLYLGLYVVSLIMALAMLLFLFLTQSPRCPWVAPRALWLWTLFLFLAIFPAIFPATQTIVPFDGLRYYLKVFLAAFIIFWLGMTIARDITKVRLLFSLLVVFGAFDAIVTNIQAITGVMLFSTSRYEASLQSVGNYQLGATNISRAGAFLINPNPNACFLAMTLLMALGLLFDAPSFLSKAFYLTLTLPIFLALLFTYSTEGFLAALAGIIALIALAGNGRIRLFLLLLIFGGALVVIVCLPAQVGLLLQHASNPGELQLRIGAWQTGIRVIQAFPLTGLGLGSYVYQVQAEPYRVLAQYHVLDHPHNSYLEFAALAGLPVLIVFLTLLLFALGLALRNWVQADKRSRTLLGTGVAVVIVLSVVSLSDAGWTFFPLATLGWLVLGVISSPLLSKGLGQPIMQENNL